MSRFEVTVWIGAATSVQEVCKVFEGLRRLAGRGLIDLAIEPQAGTAMHPRVVSLRVTRNGQARWLAIDLDDDPRHFASAELARSSHYFKRSFRPECAVLAGEKHGTVMPFGLTHPVASRATAAAMMIARARSAVGWRQLATDARQLFALPGHLAFESPPASAAEPLILYQTRLWPGEDAINEQRAGLIRALRRAFGPRFIGGAIPYPFTSKHYPDLLTDLPHSLRAFPRLVRRAMIGIYSQGLLGSTGFKLSEYLSASRCIVGQPPNDTLPQPLVGNVHYLPFEDADQCLTQCDRLLSDAEAASAMRRANWDYYREGVEPAAQMLRCLELTTGLAD